MVEAANYQDYGSVELFSDWLNRGLKEYNKQNRLVKTYGSSVNGIHSNAQMSTKQLQKFCHLDEKSQQMLKMAMERSLDREGWA